MNKRQCEATKIFKEDLLRFKDNKNLIKKIEKTINILANDLEKDSKNLSATKSSLSRIIYLLERKVNL